MRGVKRGEGEETTKPAPKKAAGKKAGKKAAAKKAAEKKKEIEKKEDEWIDCGPITSLDVNLLSDNCTTAPFGDLKKMKTVVDENVRVALECDSKRYVTKNTKRG